MNRTFTQLKMKMKLQKLFSKDRVYSLFAPIFTQSRLIFLNWLLTLGSAYVKVSTEGFWRDVTSKCWDFIETGDHKVTFINDGGSGNINGSGSRIYQGENTIAVEYETGGEGYYVFFKTRDPKMVFTGGIKAGDILKVLLKGKKKIPGNMIKLNAAENQQTCQWQFEENVTFTVYAEDGIITELEYYNPTIQGSGKGYVDVSNLEYEKLDMEKR